MERKISIIIPCYNVEKYIMRCLKSIEKQTCGMEKLEVILIDDASKDNTVSIIDAFAMKYPNNVIVAKQRNNRGPGTARNLGVDLASGEYIMFVDADDMIDSAMVQKMYEKAIEHHCDIVECQYRQFAYEEYAISERIGEDWCLDLVKIENRKKYIVNIPKVAVWGKLFRRKLFIDNHIVFPEWIMGEDFFVTGLLMFIIQKHYLINERLYYYYGNSEGIIHSGYDCDKFGIMIKAKEKILNELDKRKLLQEVQSVYKEEFEVYIICNLFFSPMLLILEEIKYHRDYIRKYYPDICKIWPLQILDERHTEYMSYFKENQ